MRPKKQILLMDADDQARRVRSFLLSTRGYLVHEAHTVEHAQLIADGACFAAAIFVLRSEGDPDAMAGCGVDRVLALVPKASTRYELNADAVLLWDCSAAELLEKVRILAMRKRGPRPVPNAGVIDAA